MRLYQGNAKKLVGKKIDCYRRMGGCYPMEIIEIGGIPPSRNPTLTAMDGMQIPGCG